MASLPTGCRRLVAKLQQAEFAQGLRRLLLSISAIATVSLAGRDLFTSQLRDIGSDPARRVTT
jgi:hypothetical protein